MTTTIGIDPGLDGAIACLVDGELLDVEDMPTFSEKRGKKTTRSVNPAEIARILRTFVIAGGTPKPTVVVERVHALPGNGGVSMFNFGDGYGCIRGVVATLGFRSEFVRPAQWKPAMGLTADKGDSRRLATQRWPQHAETFRRVKDDGRAEAALLAAWFEEGR